VQLVWDLDFLSMNLGAIGVLVTNDANTCGKWAPFSFNQLLLDGLDLNPVRT
jgi:hypothetical protein